MVDKEKEINLGGELDIEADEDLSRFANGLEYIAYRMNNENEIHQHIIEQDGKKFQFRMMVEETEQDGKIVQNLVSRLVEIESNE